MPDRIAVRIWLSVPTAAAETISAARARGSAMMPSPAGDEIS